MNNIDLTKFKQDAKGNLIPLANIKEIDRLRDSVIDEAFKQVLPLKNLLAETKLSVMSDVNAFIDLSVEQYGVKRSLKGNTTLTSFDGKRRIVIAMADVLHFDERIQAAKALIDECLNEWSKGARSELKLIVSAAFDVDKQGKINVRKVLALKGYDIDDPKWQRAMTALTDSLHTQMTREYIRFYERNDETQEYEQVSLDFAKV